MVRVQRLQSGLQGVKPAALAQHDLSLSAVQPLGEVGQALGLQLHPAARRRGGTLGQQTEQALLARDQIAWARQAQRQAVQPLGQ